MKRLLMIILMVTACHRVEPDSGDRFHDDYYYGEYPDRKVSLTACDDEYVVLFDTDYKEEVLDYIDKNGFTILLEPPRDLSYPDKDGFDIPEHLDELTQVFVMGDGDINAIPHLVFSDNLYISRDSGRHLYTTHRFYVKYYDEELKVDLYEDALRYAAELKITPVGTSESGNSRWIQFICTNGSAGKPVELANWFCEEAGFSGGYPLFSSGTSY